MHNHLDALSEVTVLATKREKKESLFLARVYTAANTH